MQLQLRQHPVRFRLVMFTFVRTVVQRVREGCPEPTSPSFGGRHRVFTSTTNAFL